MYKQVYNDWLNSKKLSKEEVEQLKGLIDEKDIEYRFGKSLDFGTAGMRGIIGLGTNMMNEYTVAQATQGLADYIKTLGIKAMKRGVVISYDTRRYSYEFALVSAVVLASNNIKAYLFNEVHPVAMLSFAVRRLKTIAGIMITASHNPKEYNGYKIYGEDGAQMAIEATNKIVSFIEKIGNPLSDKILYNESRANKVIAVSKKVDKKYYKEILKLSLSKKQVKEVGKTIKIVYTPIHGSGFIPVTTVLKKMGINPIIVPEQSNFDSEFSTVEVPNPECREALSRAILMADFKGADVVFGTDPDCDRLGVALRNNENEFVTLSGNQTGILLLDYILTRLKESGKLTSKGFICTSFVSTSMAKLIAKEYGADLMEVPVGFKFIGEKIKQLDDTGKRKFIFGFEESCGYLRGTHCRDKDAVVASMLFAEMVCYYNSIGVSLFDRLESLYKKFGYTYDTNVSTAYSGLNAMKEMNAVVDKLKELNIDKIGSLKVVATRDYSKGIKRTENGQEEMDTEKVNAVYYELSGGGFVCVRPSGTEPKLKVYYSLRADTFAMAKTLFERVKEDFEKYLK